MGAVKFPKLRIRALFVLAAMALMSFAVPVMAQVKGKTDGTV